jgi:hypothetical protein
MNRVTAVAATAVTATMAAAVAIVPAMAAPRPAAAHPAAHARIKAAAQHARTTAQRATTTSARPTEIASELDGGRYVTIVHCQGVDSPPPVHLGSPGTPLIVNGVGPSAAVFKMLKQQDPYKNIYTCTVLVKEKIPGKARPAVPKKVAAHKAGCEITAGGGRTCTKKVTLNTGFGGLARQVRNHHPAG